MRTRKKILLGLLFLFALALLMVTGYAWRAFPIISGYGAKYLASAVFIQGRDTDAVLREDLNFFPVNIGSFTVNRKEASVTGSVWGLARKKAIYRKGLGATLVNDFSEAQVRAQRFALPTMPAAGRDSIPWPLGDFVGTAHPANSDSTRIAQAIAHAFAARAGDKPAYTRAVLVVYDGQIVGERYAKGFDRNTPLLGWSMSKSLTSAQIGVLVNAGKLDVDAPAPVPEWKGTDRQRITLRNLLQQASGLNYVEDYGQPSEATNMLFKKGDMGGYAAALPAQYAPGTRFYYSSGNSNILSRIIRHTVGDNDYAAFPYRALFHKIGMYSLVLEPDASGSYVGSSYSYATARDWARFGLLYLNKGRWNNEQLLPESWVTASVQPAPFDAQQQYGYQFWLNGFTDSTRTRRFYPDAPADMYYASGFGGQHVFIIPSRRLVVVRLGVFDIDTNSLLREVLSAVGK